MAPPRVRRSNQYAVTDSVRVSGQFSGDQAEVWSRVHEISEEASVHSSTAAMRDVFRERLPQLDEITDKFPVSANQIGLIAVCDDTVLGMDIVTRHEIYELLHIKLVRSYVLDASLKRGSAKREIDIAHLARDFMESTRRTAESRHESVGLGYDYRYTATGLVGSALAYESDLIHSAFFRVPPEERQSSIQDDLSNHSQRRGFRM